MPSLKTAIEASLRSLNLSLIRHASLQKLMADQSDLKLLQTLPNEHAAQMLRLFGKSRSQLRQDLFVLTEVGFKTNGFFVEFGATNGFDLSNTYLLEKEFGWQGILAEPAGCWHEALLRNRSARIEHRCVWSDSVSTLTFNETDTAELSTLQVYSDTDAHSHTRRKGKHYSVSTISLNDLLEKYGAPREMDYLSIDTEGSEFAILSAFDFDKYSFKVITCEHNFTPARERILGLLGSHGYVRKFEELSKFDDWYVRV